MSELIEDDELLYRRIPASTGWYSPDTGEIKLEAFAPHKINDLTGLSLSRAKFKSVADAAQGQPGKSYYVAVLQAGTLRANGLAVRQDPPDDLSHAELPDLNASNRKADQTLERQRLIVDLCLRVEGPFSTPA
jgi:hypothetical protein